MSGVAGKANGVALVSREAINPVGRTLGGLPFDMWAVEVDVPAVDLTVTGLVAPLQNSVGSSPLIQRQFWQAVHRMADTRRDERLVLTRGEALRPLDADCRV